MLTVENKHCKIYVELCVAAAIGLVSHYRRPAGKGEAAMTEAARLAQSYIVSSGSEAECFARAQRLAARAVCSGDEPRPCGKCRDCRKAAAGIHPDIISLSRLPDTTGKLKREIAVDQIREMSADASILPNEAEHKVYIIREAELMNESAQNAALKLLEEPPAWVLFVLCTANPERLLPTVRSRCTELSADAEKPVNEELVKLAREYLGAVAAGDRLRLYKWCAANEGMDGRQAAEFADCAADVCAAIICGEAKNPGLDNAELFRLRNLLARCGAMLRVNVGVKHIFGLLAVNSLSAARARGE